MARKKKAKPYTYYLGWSNHNVGYVGVRTANQVHASEDLWFIYKSSSRYVKEFAEQHGDPDIRVWWDHSTKSAAYKRETKIFNHLSDHSKEHFLLNANFTQAPPDTTGYKHTKETRKKISKAVKGRKAWNAGKRCPQITMGLLAYYRNSP